MRGRRWVAALAVAVGCVAACTGASEPTSQVVVLVGGEPRVDELVVTVLTENGRNLVATTRMKLAERGDTGRRLPTSFTLVPADPEHPEAHRFRLVVTGRSTLAGESLPLVRRIVVGGFSAGKTTLLPVVLSSDCVDELCRCSWAQDSCQETCEPPSIAHAARCVPVPDHARLAEIEPGDELHALAGGVGGCSSGEILDPSGQCADLDECAFGLDDCDTAPAACVNELSGAFGWQCRCPSGFQGDGVGSDGCR